MVTRSCRRGNLPKSMHDLRIQSKKDIPDYHSFHFYYSLDEFFYEFCKLVSIIDQTNSKNYRLICNNETNMGVLTGFCDKLRRRILVTWMLLNGTQSDDNILYEKNNPQYFNLSSINLLCNCWNIVSKQSGGFYGLFEMKNRRKKMEIRLFNPRILFQILSGNPLRVNLIISFVEGKIQCNVYLLTHEDYFRKIRLWLLIYFTGLLCLDQNN